MRADRAEYQRIRYNRWVASHPEGIRTKHLKARFGLTLADYEALVEKQGGLCALCGQPETKLGRGGNLSPLAVDHEHNTKRVRSLLCHNCNVMLGHGREDPNLLRRAADYLEHHAR